MLPKWTRRQFEAMSPSSQYRLYQEIQMTKMQEEEDQAQMDTTTARLPAELPPTNTTNTTSTTKTIQGLLTSSKRRRDSDDGKLAATKKKSRTDVESVSSEEIPDHPRPSSSKAAPMVKDKNMPPEHYKQAPKACDQCLRANRACMIEKVGGRCWLCGCRHKRCSILQKEPTSKEGSKNGQAKDKAKQNRVKIVKPGAGVKEIPDMASGSEYEYESSSSDGQTFWESTKYRAQSTASPEPSSRPTSSQTAAVLTAVGEYERIAREQLVVAKECNQLMLRLCEGIEELNGSRRKDRKKRRK